MGTPSATTHEFCRGKVDGDGSCLYTSFRHVNGSLGGIDNKRLRSMVADYIRRNTNFHLAVLQSGTKCKTVKDYCNQIEKHNLWGGEPEIRALVMLSRISIRLVSMTKTVQGNINITILNYGEDVQSFEECVHILYDEENKHYDPLYVINKQNPNEKMTIFKRDDEAVRDLLNQFIREKLHGDDFAQLGCRDSSYETEPIRQTYVLDEPENIYDKIIPTASTSLPSKRKLPVYDNLLSLPTTEIHLPTSTSDNNCVSEKPAKAVKLDICNELVSDENNGEPITIEQYLQMDIPDLFEIQDPLSLEQQSTADVSVISKQEEGMRFEVDPAPKFRGRTLSEFKPKKAQKRNGQPSEAGSPRYFTAGNTRQYLNLLIPETYLSADLLQDCLEICIVTAEINGYTYIHPYFKFQVHPTDRQSPNLNPIYKFIDSTTELKSFSDKAFRQLILKLVVVMHTNKELMQSEQPLPIFSSSNNNSNQSPITMKYDQHDAFKNAYHLHEIRFAITLWKKNRGEKIFYPHMDKQYFSSVSIQDKTTRVRTKQSTVDS